MENNRIYFGAKTVLILIMALILCRVLFLTTMMGGHFSELAVGNMIHRDRLDPIRGVISDRNGKPLAMNIELLGKTVRFYPGGETTAGIVGYLSKASSDDLQNCPMCTLDAIVGKAGLEKAYQNDLIGTPGEAVVQAEANGQDGLEVSRTESLPGKNLQTNIDMELQKLAFVALKKKLGEIGKSGAMIIAKVNGEVLSLVSAPSFDPNLFIAEGKRSDFGGDFKDTASIISDTDKKPLFNRAISGEYAPGSVFKLVPAIGVLEEGKITKNTLVMDTGEIKVGGSRFGNWFWDEYGRTEGEINIVKAISRSNDIFFYKMGEALGADSLIAWSKRFGLGAKTGIDLPGEADGFVATPYWREKTLGERWYLGNTYHMAIGQGDLMASPIQVNRMTAGVISGVECPPRLVGTAECTDLKTSAQNREIVLEGMKGACEPGGTAFPLFSYADKIYCKTGTAQKGLKDTLANAWVSVVVPKGADIRNWIVITVVIEEGGQGSVVAAPVVGEVLPYILKI